MLSVRKLLLALFMVLASFTNLRAQEKLEVSAPQNIEKSRLTLDLRFDIDCPMPKYSTADEFPRHFAPGEIVYEYGGLQGVLLNRVASYQHRFFGRSLDAAFNGSSMSLADRSRIEEAFWSSEVDAKWGRWWERSWRESLVPEQGGAGPPLIIPVGVERTMFEFAGFEITNTGKIRLGDTDIYLHRTVVEDREVRSVISGIVHHREFRLADVLEVSVRPKVNIRGSIKPREVISSVALDFNAKLSTPGSTCPFCAFHTHAGRPLLVLSASCEYEPATNVGSAHFQLVILIW